MARTVPAGNGGPAARTPSVAQQASDPAVRRLTTQRSAREIAEFLDSSQRDITLRITGENLGGRGFGSGLYDLPSSNLTPGGVAERFQQTMADEQTGLYNASLKDRLAGDFSSRKVKNAIAKLQNLGYTKEAAADYYYRPIDPTDIRYQGPRDEDDNFDPTVGLAVVLTDYPTSSTNYKRPRTLAAGYDMDVVTRQGTVTVLFRDGTLWNYYDVPEYAWIKFHDSVTKGPFLNRETDKHPRVTFLAYKHGPADLGSMSDEARLAMTKMARVVQVTSANVPSKEKRFVKKFGYSSFTYEPNTNTFVTPKYGTKQNYKARQRKNNRGNTSALQSSRSRSKLGTNPHQK